LSFPTTGSSNGTNITKTSNTQIKLKGSNTYRLKGLIVRFASSSTWGVFQWYDVTNSAYVGTQGFGEMVTSGTSAAANTETIAYVSPTADTTYELRQTAPNTITITNNGQSSSIEITQINNIPIAVQATATGTVNKDYIYAGISTDPTVNTNSIIIPSASLIINQGSATVDTATGYFTLVSGKTYKLTGALALANIVGNSEINYQWINITNGNTLIGNQGGILVVNQSVPAGWQPTAEAVIQTNATTQVALKVTFSGSNNQVKAGQSYMVIEEITTSFSLNTLSTMSTTGNVSIGGNLTVSGNIIGNVYSSPDSAVSTFMFLGTWTTVQNGESLYMRLISHAGYNAIANQNQVTELMFATANGSSYVSGSTGNYYANGLASVNSRLGTGGSSSPFYQAPVKFRIVQVSVTSYQIYVYYGVNYMGRANYSVQIGPATTWTDSSTVVSAPGGNYLEITPTAF
jgi:hypothetical protein